MSDIKYATMEQLEFFEKMGFQNIPFDEVVAGAGVTGIELIDELGDAYERGGDKWVLQEYDEDGIKKEVELNTVHVTDFTYSGVVNLIAQQRPYPKDDFSAQQMSDDIKAMVKKMKTGDTTDILTVLTTNLMQVQSFNGRVTTNVGKEDLSFKNWELLSKMQMRLIQEARKTTMALNEICNPKRAMFIKNATQNNNLISEKKSASKNELSQPIEEEIIDAYQYTETAEVTIREDKEN